MTQAKSRTLPLRARGLNFEMFMWYVTRLTALAMYVLVLLAVLGALLMGARTQMNLADVLRWGFMPNSPHVQNTDLPDLAPWSTPFWRLVASALFLVAAAHGVHGAVVVLDDYLVRPAARRTVRVLSVIFLITMSLIGLYVIWTS